MPASPLNDVLRQVSRLAAPSDDAPGDAELLRRFLDGSDERAFEGLLRRHGPMVLGVCRRILGNEADVEDAFQAVFLVLARKASGLKHHGPLGGWLHGVAHNTALKARAMRRKRQEKEREAVATRPTEAEDVWPELCALLDEELGRLPDPYREAIVQCDLEGKTIRAAARQLGWPQGTLASRLARGRTLLAARLRRCGVLTSARALASALTPEVSPLPAPLVSATLRALTAGSAASTTVACLTEGVLKGMLLQKLHGLGAVAVVAVAVLAVCLSGLAAVPAKPEQGKRGSGKREALKDDPLPPQALARLGTTRLRNGDQLGQVHFSTDGRLLLTAGRDGRVRVWDVATGRAIRTLGRDIAPGQRPGIRFPYSFLGLRVEAQGGGARTGVVFSADGRRAALAEPDGSVSLWDTGTGKERDRLAGTRKQGGVFGLGLSRDGAKLVSRGKDETLIIWDTNTGKEWRLPTGPAVQARRRVAFGIDGESVENYVFSSDGKCLATLDVDDKLSVVLQVWDLDDGKELWRVQDPRSTGLRPPAFGAEGRTLVRLADDHTVRVHDAATGKEVRRIDAAWAGLYPTWTALAGDGRTFAVQTAEGVVVLFDVEKGKKVRELGTKGPRRFGASSTAIAFSPDGKTLAQGVAYNSVRLWDVTTGKALPWAGAGPSGSVMEIGISPDGRQVTTMSWDATLRVWDASTGRPQRQVPLSSPAERHMVGLSADGRWLAVGKDDGLRVVAASGGKEVCRLRPAVPRAGPLFRSARFSADGRRIASAGSAVQPRGHWILQVWDVPGGKERQEVRGETWTGNWPPDFDRYLADYALSADGSLLLTLANEPLAAGVPQATQARMRMWHVDSGKERWSVEADAPFRAGAFAADGRTVAASTRQGVVVVEVASGKERVRFKRPAWKVALSPDGRLLAAAADSTVELWDVWQGTSLGKLAGHQANVDALTFGPDGKVLVSGSADSTALVWDVARLVPRRKQEKLSAKEVESRWTDLAGADAARAFRAIAALAAAPKQSVPFLKERLRPVAAADERRIARLIERLDSDQFAQRTAATRELEKLGDLAGPALRKAREARPSLEVRQRIEALLNRRHRLPAEDLRVLRAVEVLERAGTAPARTLLEALAKGAAAALLTREARAAVGRLGR